MSVFGCKISTMVIKNKHNVHENMLIGDVWIVWWC